MEAGDFPTFAMIKRFCVVVPGTLARFDLIEDRLSCHLVAPAGESYLLSPELLQRGWGDLQLLEVIEYNYQTSSGSQDSRGRTRMEGMFVTPELEVIISSNIEGEIEFL